MEEIRQLKEQLAKAAEETQGWKTKYEAAQDALEKSSREHTKAMSMLQGEIEKLQKVAAAPAPSPAPRAPPTAANGGAPPVKGAKQRGKKADTGGGSETGSVGSSAASEGRGEQQSKNQKKKKEKKPKQQQQQQQQQQPAPPPPPKGPNYAQMVAGNGSRAPVQILQPPQSQQGRRQQEPKPKQQRQPRQQQQFQSQTQGGLGSWTPSAWLPPEEPPPSSAVAGAAPTAVERAQSELHEKRQGIADNLRNAALANDKGRLQVAVRDAEAAGMSHEANIGRRKLATLL